MPALIAHCYVATTVIEKIEEKDVLRAIQNHKNLYLLSAQGPDVYYYYGLLKKANNLVKTGWIIHKEKPAMAIDLLRNEILNAPNKFERECAIAILAGFLCHYALDRNAHPYVYYLQKMLEKKENRGGLHPRVEAHLDAWIMYNRFGELRPDFHKSIFLISREELTSYTVIFARLARNISSSPISPIQLLQAVKTMKRVLRVFYSRSLVIRILSSVCQKMTYKWMRGADFFIPKQPDGCVDYLNLEKREWFNTFDPNLTATYSFPEILDEACDDSIRLIESLCDPKKKHFSAQLVTKNISFDSGLKI